MTRKIIVLHSQLIYFMSQTRKRGLLTASKANFNLFSIFAQEVFQPTKYSEMAVDYSKMASEEQNTKKSYILNIKGSIKRKIGERDLQSVKSQRESAFPVKRSFRSSAKMNGSLNFNKSIRLLMKMQNNRGPSREWTAYGWAVVHPET